MADHAKFITLTPEVYDYLIAHGHNGDPIRAELAAETAKLGRISGMQIAAEQGTFMAILAAAIGARSAVEVGTFTGYSALCVARALPADGRLLCCDVNEEWTSIARRYWKRAGVEDKIELRLAPAVETLSALPDEEVFDLAFIDADKPRYSVYYREILRRLRPNGVILVDNTLWGGRIADPSADDEQVTALRAFNDMVVADPAVDCVLLTLGDGLTLVRKH
jgi:caffeoyl-CoA O-methyltransferase